MKNFRPFLSLLWVTTLAVVLTACGGSGGGGGNDNKSSAASSLVSSSVQSSSSRTSSSASSVLQSSSSTNSSSVLSSSSLSSSISSSPLSSSGTITAVTIHYKRPALDYTGWGLHLWGSAIAPNMVTQWESARAFDEVIDGWNIAVVPVVNPAVNFNFIVHNGNNKSPTNDLFFIPSVKGADVWVVQDNNTLFFSQEEAEEHVIPVDVGNASAALDLTDVVPTTVNSELPIGWNKSASFMEIFVRSYQDSDGDGHGDLQGLIDRLDYLQSLGVTGIWLMPVMESSDNDHGYSVIDYRKIESDYGTMEDFETLLAEAHERGIGVIIDYVMNHSSYANPLFMDAAVAEDNDKHDWYIFSDTNPGWTNWNINAQSWHTSAVGFYYGIFNSGLPDFNLHNPDVVNFHANNLRFWLNKGVDGFRFDATGLLFENGADEWIDQPENHPLLAEMQAVINSYDNRYMICESTDSPAEYAIPSSCINTFAFGYQWDVKNTAKNRSLASGLATLLKSSTKETMPLFLSNHDSFAGDRPVAHFSSVQNEEIVVDVNSYKVAAAISILASSTPFTYYGEEIGMSNYIDDDNNNDGDLRTPMSWTANTTNAGFTTGQPYRVLSSNVADFNVAVQSGVSGSLLEHYRALYTVRKNNPVLGTGTLSFKSSSGNTHVIFTRTDGANVAAVLINLSLSAQNLSVATGANNADFLQKLPATDAVFTSNGSGSITVNVPAQSAVVVTH